MHTQPSFTASIDARHEAAMKTWPTYTVKILRDDIRWLENCIRQLQASDGARERRLAACYQKLLRQRQHQLATSARLDGACCSCWNEYLC
jgi:hypothetical protein